MALQCSTRIRPVGRKAIATLVLMRHGESLWNRENRFTGWADPDLSPRGEEESRSAARLLVRAGFEPDLAFTSMLRRAVRSARIVLEEMGRSRVPVVCDWRLNGRHYGALQGLDKDQTVERYGAEQVKIWRRSFATSPPILDRDDPRHPARDPRYATIPPDRLPAGESLEEASVRLLECWRETISRRLRDGERVLIVSHGNLLRGLVKHLEDLTAEEIVSVEIATAVPLIYELDDGLRVTAKRVLESPV